jgi:hypothetical protein
MPPVVERRRRGCVSAVAAPPTEAVATPAPDAAKGDAGDVNEDAAEEWPLPGADDMT